MSVSEAGEFTLSARKVDVQDTLEGSTQLIVPDYQREYSWKKKQWRDLWDDLRALVMERENHFLGSIVIIEDQYEDKKIEELVDGQQRISTIAIVLCAIRDELQGREEDDYENIVASINNFLWVKNKVSASGETHQKIKLNGFHNPDFKRVLDGEVEELDSSQLKKAYEFYRERLSGTRSDTIEDIYSNLLLSVSMVRIECGSQVSAFRLFESLNEKGLDLGQVDLVKNRIFMEANEDPNIDEKRVKDLWEDILNTIRPEMNSTYRFFSHYYMAIPEPEVHDNVSRRMIYDHTKELIDKRLSEEEIGLVEFLEDMQEKAELYVDIMNAEVSEDYRSGKLEELNQKIEANQLKSKRVRTLLLRILMEYDNADDVIEALAITEVFNSRNAMTKTGTSTSGKDEFWSRTASMMFTKPNPNKYLKRICRDRAPSDTVLEDGVQSKEFKRNDFTKYVLNRIEEEHYMRSGGSVKRVADRSTVDIEHIAPSGSFRDDKYSKWKRYLDCGEEEFEENRKRLGNLTLLEDKYNKAAGDDPFEEKLLYYRNNTDFRMTQEIAEEYDEWGVSKIDERSEDLAKIAVDIWNFDNV